jgi:hypothetical protein
MSETAQPTPETDEKKSRGLESYVFWAFVAVMVYVLSSGPALKYLYHLRSIPKRTATGNVLEILYSPVFWAYGATPLRKPLGMYWHLWKHEAFDTSGNPGPQY